MTSTPAPLLLDAVRTEAAGNIRDAITLVTLALTRMRHAGLTTAALELEGLEDRERLMMLAQHMELL